MSQYKLELLVDKDYVENPKEEIIERAKSFGKYYFMSYRDRIAKLNSNEVMKIYDLFQDLEDARFWGVLSRIDGSGHYTQPDDLVKREEARKWAKETFDEHQLNKILNIVVNQALLIPYETSWPGTYRGHAILYEELVDKKDSMFYGVVDENFHKVLNNGRFWEELTPLRPGLNGGYSYHIIEDVLANNFQELDINFAAEGLKKIYKDKDKNSTQSSFDMRFLSNKAIDNYSIFIKDLFQNLEKLRLSKRDLEGLVRPYINAIIDFDEERFESRFYDLKDRLNEQFISHYIKNSFWIKQDVAEQLKWDAEHEHIEHVIEVLKKVPNVREIFDMMMKDINQPSNVLLGIHEELDKSGNNIKFLLKRANISQSQLN